MTAHLQCLASVCVKSSGNEVSGNSRFGHLSSEPTADIFLQPDAVHKVVERFVECLPESVMIDAGRVNEADIVFGERHRGKRNQRDSIFLRVLSDGRMNCAGKSVEEAALDTAFFKQLPNVLQCVNSVLHCLRWKTIHQIRMHQNSGIAESASDAGNLLNRDTLLHQI